MRIAVASAVAASLIALAGCATDRETAAGLPTAQATLASASGAPRGTATMVERDGTLRLALSASGMRPGTYAIHLHTGGIL